MTRWAIFLTASLVLHLMILIIPFPVFISEDPEPFRLVVDVNLVKPAKEDSLPPASAETNPAPGRPSKTDPAPARTKESEEPFMERSPQKPQPASRSLHEDPSEHQEEPRVARASDVVKRVHPVYPLASRRRGEEGEVSLLASIGPRGEVARVTVLESSGYTALDESALNAVRKWLFSPGTPEKLIVPVIFKLEQ